MAASYESVSPPSLKVHEGTVPLPFLPLDDSQGDVTKEDVKRKVQEYLACFSDPNSVMVLDHVESLVTGCSMLDTWLTSTRNQGGGRTLSSGKFSVVLTEKFDT